MGEKRKLKGERMRVKRRMEARGRMYGGEGGEDEEIIRGENNKNMV